MIAVAWGPAGVTAVIVIAMIAAPFGFEKLGKFLRK